MRGEKVLIDAGLCNGCGLCADIPSSAIGGGKMYNIYFAELRTGNCLAPTDRPLCHGTRPRLSHRRDYRMAQRGCCVVSHVRVGEGFVSPTIPHGYADVIIAFEPGEAVRALPYLCAGGAVVVCNETVKPVTDSLSGGSYSGDVMLGILRECVGRLTVVPVCAACGNLRSLNMALLGAAAAVSVIPRLSLS